MSQSANRKAKRTWFKGHAKILRNFYNGELVVSVIQDYIRCMSKESNIEITFENLIDYVAKDWAKDADQDERYCIREYIASDCCMLYEYMSKQYPAQTMRLEKSGPFCMVLLSAIFKNTKEVADDYTNMKTLLNEKTIRDLFNVAMLK